MRYSLLINAGPNTRASQSALHCARAILSRGHSLFRVFFYRDGVAHATGKDRLSHDWQSLILEQHIDAVVCVGAMQRRDIETTQILDGFDVSGLGQLAEAMIESDRVLQFG